MTRRLNDDALNQLFREARTHNAWQKRDIPDALLHEVVDLMKMGPTSANMEPARIVFVKSPEAKARLKPLLLESKSREDDGRSSHRGHRPRSRVL